VLLYPFLKGPICYLGSFKDSSWHGQGTLRLTNSITFIGTFSMARIIGQGTLHFKNGESLEGFWQWIDIPNHYKGTYLG